MLPGLAICVRVGRWECRTWSTATYGSHIHYRTSTADWHQHATATYNLSWPSRYQCTANCSAQCSCHTLTQQHGVTTAMRTISASSRHIDEHRAIVRMDSCGNSIAAAVCDVYKASQQHTSHISRPDRAKRSHAWPLPVRHIPLLADRRRTGHSLHPLPVSMAPAHTNICMLC